MNTVPVTERGWPWLEAFKRRLYATISRKYMPGCSNYNPVQVRRSCRSKAQARAMFEAHQVPHAQGEIWINPWRAWRFARTHGFPLCIKPNVSGFSRGSHFPITDYRQLWKAVVLVKLWWPSSVIEQYLQGANYRVLATPDELASVIRRYPPFVDGNGRDSIATLIDAENATREAMGLYPTVHPIPDNDQTIRYLKRQGLTLASVPAQGRRVYTCNRIALAPGGVVEVVDQHLIPEANRQLFQQVVQRFQANLLGIDVIFEKGIEIDYREQRCIFLEVNSRPYTRMHSVPRFGQAEDLSGFYARMDSLAIADTDTF